MTVKLTVIQKQFLRTVTISDQVCVSDIDEQLLLMEKELDRVVEEIMATPNVNGYMVADHQGLCLTAKGSAHVDSAGIVVAISEQACKIQPNLKPPTVCLETETKECLIQRHGTITGVVFKQKG